MKSNLCKIIVQTVAASLLFAVVLPQRAGAQFTGNSQTNIINGVANNWSGNYYVGSNYVFDALVIQNAGMLSNSASGYIGYAVGANSNSAIVSGSGSVWKSGNDLWVGRSGAGNSLVISNGGTVVSLHGGDVGYNTTASNNSVVVTGSGSAWSIRTNGFGSGFFVGDSGAGNVLMISAGGAVFNDRNISELGNFSSASNNRVLVTGSGSVWSNAYSLTVGRDAAGNSLVISNGGAVYNLFGAVGQNATAINNSVMVTGNGSIWNAGILYFGLDGASNTLVVTNGGQLLSDSCVLGDGGSNNSVVVTGSGSVWRISDSLYVGNYGAGNSVVITNGGFVTAHNAYVGLNSGTDGSRINVSGGGICVTNALANGVLDIQRGALTSDRGTVTTDKLLLTNGSASVIAFNGGVLNSAGTAVTNTQQFVVGNGTSSANFHLQGGVHSFNNSLRIRTNSFLTGCGTINGSVLVDPGAAVHANCTNLVFTGNVTNNGTMVAVGAVLECFGTFVNNGKIYLLNGGTTNFHGSFINNGQILSGDIRLAITRDGNGGLFVRYTGTPDVTYRLQRAPSVTGPWSDRATNTAPASGLIEYHENTPPPGQAFYRTVQP